MSMPTATVLHGDCLDIMAAMPPDSVDAVGWLARSTRSTLRPHEQSSAPWSMMMETWRRCRRRARTATIGTYIPALDAGHLDLDSLRELVASRTGV